MGSILFLLVLFVVATLLSRGRVMSSLSTMTATPVLIGLGYLLSPQLLGIALPSLIEGLVPALRLAALWVTFLIGLRFTLWALKEKNLRDLAQVSFLAILTLLLTLSLAYLVLAHQKFFEFSLEQVLALSFILGGLIASSSYSVARMALAGESSLSQKQKLLLLTNHDDLFSVIAICIGIYLWPVQNSLSPELWSPSAFIYFSLSIGAVLALAVRLMIDPNRGAGVHWRLALVGLATLGAGSAVGALTSEALVGFFFGFLLANLYRRPLILDPVLRASEAPVRLVLYFLAGVYLELSWPLAALAGGLVVIRFVTKALVRFALREGAQKSVPLSSLTGFSGLALPVALSLYLSPLDLAQAQLILSVVVLTVFFSDLLTFALWPWRKVEVVRV